MSNPGPAMLDTTWGERLRLLGVTVLWIATFVVLARFGARWLPLSLARRLTYETFLTLIQIATMSVGLALTVLLVARPREQLALCSPSVRAAVLVVLVTPAVYVVVSYLAVAVALPTLLEELRRGGAQLARSHTGEFGRAMVAAPWWTTVLWAVVISPVGEELLFRGALWSTLQRFVERMAPPPASERLPREFIRDSIVVVTARRSWAWLRTGGIATIVSGGVFALMHTGMAGGQGILRVAAASGLGLACGVARQAGGSLAIPVLLHAAFNLLSLSAARRWVVSDTFPNWFMVPTLLSAVAGVGLIAALVVALAWRRSSARPPARA
jgi:membrane protease YdiL (CAAX protease family)